MSMSSISTVMSRMNSVSASLESASVSVSTWCQSTKQNGCAKKNSGSTTNSGLSNKILAIFTILLLFGVVNAEEEIVSEHTSLLDASDMNVTYHSVTDHIEAIQVAWKNHLNGLHTKEDIFYDKASQSTISNIEFPEPKSLEKRWDEHNAPLGTWFEQHTVVVQGIKNATHAVSGCIYTGQGSGSLEMTWTEESKWSVDKGFDFSTAKISAQDQLGVNVSKHYSQGFTARLDVPLGTVGQLYSGTQMVWQHQQRRSCVRRTYGENGLHCKDWSIIIHGELPISNGIPLVDGRIGSDRVSC